MSSPLTKGALCVALLSLYASTPVAAASQAAEIAELRAMLNQMKAHYERRIADLEARIEDPAASGTPRRASADAAPSLPMSAPLVIPASATTKAPAGGPGGSGLGGASAFNPQISVILDGVYYNDGVDGAGAGLLGTAWIPGRVQHDHEHEGEAQAEHEHSHGDLENGFNLRESEIAFTATVDPWFDAALLAAIDSDGNVELEEAWFQTRALPAGLQVKGGRFLSDFGYANHQHPHEWDFVDQNLPYLNLIGPHGLSDTGLQVTWLPELPFYTRLGLEALQGNQETFGATLSESEQVELNLGDTDNGPRLWTTFAKLAPNLGALHALQFGVSYAHASQHQEVQTHTHEIHAHEGEAGHADEVESEHTHEGDAEHETTQIEVHETGLAGDADLWGLDVVYTYDGNGADGHRDLRLQAEYLRSIRDLEIRASAHPEQIGQSSEFTTDGFYAQGVYGIAPKWTLGARYDQLGLTNQIRGMRYQDLDSSDRWTLALTWNLSEFSRLRAQYAYNNIALSETDRERFDAFYVQYVMSLGAHGAHAF